MPDSSDLLTALQYGDSFFPAGGIAFSWGVETLVNDAQVDADSLASCVSAQLSWRWNSFDRPFLVAAYACAQRHGELASLDRELDSMLLAREAREGSRRAGGSLLLMHDKLGTTGAAAYRQGIAQGHGHGHLCVAQGLVCKGVGMSLTAMQSVCAYTFCVGMVSAALRLGQVGHLRAQQVLTQARPIIARLLETPAADTADAYSFAPAAEIAMMRHEIQTSRLFAN